MPKKKPKTGPGRPPTTSEGARDKSVRLRVTEGEHRRFTAAAAREGQSLSDWLRQLANDSGGDVSARSRAAAVDTGVRDQTIRVLVTAEDLEALRAAAEAEGQSMSSFMRDAGLKAAKRGKR